MLLVTTSKDSVDSAAQIISALESCREDLGSPPRAQPLCAAGEERLAIVEKLGVEHGDWFEALEGQHAISPGPVTRSDGSVAAEPLFVVDAGEQKYACFPEPPSAFIVGELEDLGVSVLAPGGEVVTGHAGLT